MAPRALCVSTGQYTGPGIAGSGLVAVGVTRYRPRFPLPGYTLKTNLVDLAPSAELLAQARSVTITAKQFEAQYIRQIEKVGVKAILSILRRLQGDARGVVLLCYEDVHAGERCHRRMLAEWLQRKVGLMIPEYRHDMVAARPVVVGYARISKAGDAKSVSIATQKAQIAAYATAQGWGLVDVIADDGVSGGRRGRFTGIDAALKQHRAKALIVYTMDRAGRPSLPIWVRQ